MSSATTCRLLALVLLVGCDSQRAATVESGAEPIEATGETACGEVHRLIETTEGLALEPDPGLGLARVAWEGDLNSDGREDLIVRFGDACSGSGECPIAVLAACEASGFEMAWEPEYALEIAPLRRRPLAKGPAALCESNQSEPNASSGEAIPGWMPLIETRRDGDRTERRVLCFTADGYASAGSVESG